MSIPNDSEIQSGLDQGGKKDLGKEELFELLGEEDDKPEVLDLSSPKKKETDEHEEEGEEVKSDAEKELEEIEEELKPPTEEDLELVTPIKRREILAKYPQLFKDFPYLEKAYYREQQFTEVFPTVNEAKQAAEKAQIMDGFDREIMHGGNIQAVLQAVKEEDPEVFKKVIDNYLVSLGKIDEPAYYHVVGNVIKDTIITMVQEAKKIGDEGQPLLNAANIIHQFVFGTNQFTPPQKLAKEVKQDDKETEIQTREQEFIRNQYQSTKNELQTKVDNVLKATIEGNIDRNKSMSDYVRKNAVRDAFESLNKMIDTDSRFRNLLDRLWDAAAQSRFNRESTDRIRSAYLSKAKTLLPTVIKKARIEALRGTGKKVTEEEDNTDRRGPITPGRSASPNRGRITKPADIPKHMSTLDFLNQE